MVWRDGWCGREVWRDEWCGGMDGVGGRCGRDEWCGGMDGVGGRCGGMSGVGDKWCGCGV